MLINHDFNEIEFTSNFEKITIYEVFNDLFFSVLKKTENEKYEELIQEYYYSDSSNNVVILSIDKLLTKNIETNGMFRFVFQEGGNVLSFDCEIIKSVFKINLNTNYFLDNCFLSFLTEDKITYKNSVELISFYTKNQININFTAKYKKEDGSFIVESNLFDVSKKTGINTIDVSSLLFEKKDFKLIKYAIFAGERNFVFYVNNFKNPNLLISFKNNFGVFETVSIDTILEYEIKIDRESAYLNNTFKNYLIEDTQEYFIRSNFLSQKEILFYEQLFYSEEIFLIEKRSWFKISIIENSIKRILSKDELTFYEFKYRFSEKQQKQLNFKQRIFDKTFDKTFN